MNNLTNKINNNLKLKTMSYEDKLHFQAIELMEKYINKYKLHNMILLSLDEFVLEYSYILHPNEIKEINNLINKF